MNILVIGAGAIGGSLAVRLSKVASVTVLERNTETVNIIRERGMTLFDLAKRRAGSTNDSGMTSTDCSIVSELSDGDSFDVCFTATRAYHLKSAVTSVLPYLKPDSIVVSMNNGVCIDDLIEVVGEDRAAACSINYGVGIRDVGSYYVKIDGNLIIGMRRNIRQLIDLAQLISNVIPCKVTDNIVGELYSKMLINSCITSTAILTGLTLGEILRVSDGRKVFDAILTEGIRVAKLMGIYVPPYKGKLNYYFLTNTNALSKLFKRIQYRLLGNKYGKRTSATLEALKRGTPTETAYYNGYISRLGKLCDALTPVNDAVCELIASIEKDLTLINPDNLAKVLA